jgi:hypothetical protein
MGDLKSQNSTWLSNIITSIQLHLKDEAAYHNYYHTRSSTIAITNRDISEQRNQVACPGRLIHFTPRNPQEHFR